MQRVAPGIVIVLKEVQSCNFCIYSGTISFLDAFLPDGDVRSHNRSPKVEFLCFRHILKMPYISDF